MWLIQLFHGMSYYLFQVILVTLQLSFLHIQNLSLSILCPQIANSTLSSNRYANMIKSVLFICRCRRFLKLITWYSFRHRSQWKIILALALIGRLVALMSRYGIWYSVGLQLKHVPTIISQIRDIVVMSIPGLVQYKDTILPARGIALWI